MCQKNGLKKIFLNVLGCFQVCVFGVFLITPPLKIARPREFIRGDMVCVLDHRSHIDYGDYRTAGMAGVSYVVVYFHDNFCFISE